MKKILIGVVIILTTILVYKTCADSNADKTILKESSLLIEQELKNVSKLIVTEGHFAEVYTYADSKELFGAILTADKKALVVVNADVSIAYDLAQIDFKIDEETKTVSINNLPEPEVKINPDFEYYDITADYLNPFKANDYNTIKKNVHASLSKKIEASTLKTNAKNRLVTELANLLLVTNSIGWTLVYKEQPIAASKLESLLLD